MVDTLCRDSKDRILSLNNAEFIVSPGRPWLKCASKIPQCIEKGAVKEFEIATDCLRGSVYIDPRVFKLPCSFIHSP